MYFLPLGSIELLGTLCIEISADARKHTLADAIIPIHKHNFNCNTSITRLRFTIISDFLINKKAQLEGLIEPFVIFDQLVTIIVSVYKYSFSQMLNLQRKAM